MGRYQMPPTSGFVLPADQIQGGRIVKTGRGEVITVHRDAVQLGDGIARVLIGIADKVAGQLQHGTVKGEIGVKGGALAQRLETLGNPAERLLGWRSLRTLPKDGKRPHEQHSEKGEGGAKTNHSGLTP